MATLIVSDIHGNVAALDAIAAAERFDEVICLGDVVGYGPEPAACLRWLRSRDALIVQGNHDRALGENVGPGCAPQFQWLADATFQIGETQLTSEERDYLATLPRWAAMHRDGLRFMLVHAAPRDPLSGYRPCTVNAWADEVNGVDADILLVGHTHDQFELEIGTKCVVNPGSVGQPKVGDPRACYAILERGSVRLRRVAYAVEDTIRGLINAGVQSEAVDALAELLRTGAVGARINASVAATESPR